MQYTEAEKIAVVIMSLENEKEGLGASLLKDLSPASLKKVASAMANLKVIDKESADGILREFSAKVHKKSEFMSLDPEKGLSAIVKALGKEDAFTEVLKQASENLKITDEFTAEELYSSIENENIGLISIVMLHLSPPKAAKLLSMFNLQQQLVLILRMSKTKEVDSETLSDIREFLEDALVNKEHKVKLNRNNSKFLADVLVSMGEESSQIILDDLSLRSGELAEKISENMFVFEDIFKLPNSSLAIVAQSFTLEEWTVALKATSEREVQLIKSNISQRNAVILEEELALAKSIRKVDQDEIRKKIASFARQKIASGELQGFSKEDVWV